MSYVDSANGITYTLSGTNATVTAYDKNVTTTPTILSTFVDGGVTYTVNALTANVFGSNTCTSINIPATITSIPDYCFKDNRVLTTVTLNGNIAIGNQSFLSCVFLSNFDFTYVTSIADNGFAGAGSATTFASPANMPNITSFGNNGFNNSGVTSITFGPNITTFGEMASSASQLTSVTVQAAGQITLADYNFNNTSQNITFTFENSTVIPIIETNSFFGVTTIVFNGTNYTNEEFLVYTENLYIDPTHGIKYGIDKSNNSAFIFGYDHTISTTPVIISSITLASITYSLTTIGYGLFQSNTNMTEVTIPAEIVLIGSYAFRDCTNLIKVTFLGQTIPSLQTGATLLNIHPNAVAHVNVGVDTTAITSRFSSIVTMITVNLPAESSVTNSVVGSRVEMTSLTTDDLTDTSVVGETQTAKRSYTRAMMEQFITNYSSALTGKRLKLKEGAILPGYSDSLENDVIVINAASSVSSTTNNTISASDIAENDFYVLMDTNDSITFPTNNDTVVVTKTDASTYSIQTNVGTDTASSESTYTYDGLTLNLGSIFGSFVQVQIICFREGSMITCLDKDTGTDKEIAVEKLSQADYVKTYKHGYIRVDRMGNHTVSNPGHEERLKNRMYCLSPNEYPELTQPLYITGYHSVLVDKISDEEQSQMREILGDLYKTDDKYRLIASCDARAKPYECEGKFNVWHVCLEHYDETMNYGIYANGLLVESCSARNMSLGLSCV